MVNLSPIPRAPVPANPAAANVVSARNYDEFQDTEGILAHIAGNRANVLNITMPHVLRDSENFEEGSKLALARAKSKMQALIKSDLTREIRDLLWVYEIRANTSENVRQIGIGGYAKTAEIRTKQTPNGIILRNEEVREGFNQR